MHEKRRENVPVPEQIGYERRDVNIRKLIIVGVVITVLLIVILVALNEFFMITVENIEYEQSLRPPSEALLKLRQHEEEVLNSYGIVDAGQEKYRIPIDRAMEIIAERESRAR